MMARDIELLKIELTSLRGECWRSRFGTGGRVSSKHIMAALPGVC